MWPVLQDLQDIWCIVDFGLVIGFKMFFLAGKVIDHYINLYRNKEALTKKLTAPQSSKYICEINVKHCFFYKVQKLQERTTRASELLGISKESSFKTQEGTQKERAQLGFVFVGDLYNLYSGKVSINHHSGKYLWIFAQASNKQNFIEQKDMMNFTFTFFFGGALGGSSRDRTWLGCKRGQWDINSNWEIKLYMNRLDVLPIFCLYLGIPPQFMGFLRFIGLDGPWPISPPKFPDRRFPPKRSEVFREFQASPRPSPTRISQHRIPVLRGDTWCTRYLDRVRWRWNYSYVSSP